MSVLKILIIGAIGVLTISCAPLPPVVPHIPVKSSANYDPDNITGVSEWNEVLSPWLGVPYVSGGTSKRGVDCSGFTSIVYMEKERKNLPRTSEGQFKEGMSVDRGSLAVGDLVFFGERGKVNHVGIYAGNENFIHASTSSGVMVSPLEDTYWKPRYMGARRL
jgi:cell wall-associated NlpC family hydrolase